MSQDLFRNGRIRGNNGRGGADGESHELVGAVRPRQFCQGSMRQAPGEGEDAAEERDATWARDAGGASVGPAVGPGGSTRGECPGEKDGGDGGDEDRESEEMVVRQDLTAQESREREGPPARIGARGGERHC